MQLTDVAEAMLPGAQRAIEKGLSLQEAGHAFRLVLCGEAVKQAQEEKAREIRPGPATPYRLAAQKLKCSSNHLADIVKGRSKTNFKRGSNTFRKQQRESQEPK